MKTIAVDNSAHEILLWAKDQCIKKGIENPSHSDAVRWLKEIKR